MKKHELRYLLMVVSIVAVILFCAFKSQSDDLDKLRSELPGHDFQLVYGVASTDPQANLVMYTHIAWYLEPEACKAIMAFQKEPANAKLKTMRDAGVSRLRQAIATAKGNGIVGAHNEFMTAQSLLDMYDETLKEKNATFSCN